MNAQTLQAMQHDKITGFELVGWAKHIQTQDRKSYTLSDGQIFSSKKLIDVYCAVTGFTAKTIRVRENVPALTVEFYDNSLLDLIAGTNKATKLFWSYFPKENDSKIGLNLSGEIKQEIAI